MSDVGVALLGSGFMGKCHALAYHAVAGTLNPTLHPRLEVIADVTLDAAELAARRYGFARASDDWRSAVQDPAVDLVSITTPNALHAEMALAAIAAGKHVYLEKPMSRTLDEAEAIAKAAEQAGVKTLVGYNYLRNPAIQYAGRLIDDGAIGRVFAFHGSCDEDYLADAGQVSSWRCQREHAGLGALGDLGCHLVSLAHFLMGPISAVFGDLDFVHKSRPVPNPSGGPGTVDNEDTASALVRFASGAKGVLSTSRVAWGRKNRLALEINGTEGTIQFDQERMNEVHLYRAETNEGFERILIGPTHPPFGDLVTAPGHGLGFNDLKVIEVHHLLEGIAEKTALYPNFGDALAIERVIHGIANSSESEGWVRFGN